MRYLILLALLALPASLAAQAQSGRHFQRTPRTVPTPPAQSAPAQDATAVKPAATRTLPLRKLHSGRPWPKWHFTRQVTTAPPTSPAEASSGAPRRLHPADKRGFWRAGK